MRKLHGLDAMAPPHRPTSPPLPSGTGPSEAPAGGAPRPYRVVTVASNKGGVGKTTVTTNLAVYLRALREELPVLVLGLDDQDLIHRMFTFGGGAPDRTVLDGIRDGDLTSAIQLGQYGVHYVPPCASISEIKSEIASPLVLRSILAATDWHGLVIIDTKSDLEILTRNALAASDLAIVVVSDRMSLREAGKVYALFDKWNRPRERARILLSLVDRRVKFRSGEDSDILALLVSEIRRLGYPLFESFLSRSPKIESLYTNPEQRAQSILHGARTSLLHKQMTHFADDLLRVLDELGPEVIYEEPDVDRVPDVAAPPPPPDAAEPRRLWTVEELLGSSEPPKPEVPSQSNPDREPDGTQVRAPTEAAEPRALWTVEELLGSSEAPEPEPPSAADGDRERDATPLDAPPEAAEPRALWTVEELLGSSEPPKPEMPSASEPEPTAVSAPTAKERRRSGRRTFACRISAFRLQDPPIIALRGRDLSTSGIGIDKVPELAVGERVRLALGPVKGGEPLLVWGRVVRADDDHSALEFEPDPGDRERIADIVDELASVSSASVPP
jgi:cellulose biosynthesis protein BcsQ